MNMNNHSPITNVLVLRGVARLASLALAVLFLAGQANLAYGKTYRLAEGDDLQKALDRVEYGDVIELEPGATFVGNFVLPKPPPPKKLTTPESLKYLWIRIRSSDYQKLPKRGERVRPEHAKHMPKIVSPNSMPALSTRFGSNRFQFVGLEITTTSKKLYNLVLLGYNGPEGRAAKQIPELPAQIAFERCYIHGNPTGQIRTGIALNGRSVSIMDCHISDFHERGSDAQALCGWNGNGPFKIVNNYLSGSGENLMFGGADPDIRGLIPSDIEIRYNHFHKPNTWNKHHDDYAGTEWTVKNLLELKSARRVLIEGNVLDNSWAQAQAGFAILITPRNQEKTAPWTTVEDVTIRNNLVRNAGGGVQILNQQVNKNKEGNPPLTKSIKRIHIYNNIFWNINRADTKGRGDMFLLSAQPNARPGRDIQIRNNTLIHGGRPHSFITMGDHNKFATNLVVTNNITTMGQYGIWGSGSSSGLDAIERYLDGYKIQGNVFVSSKSMKNYPRDNFVVSRVAEVGFKDPARGDFQLTSRSPFRNRGTDRRNPGADHLTVADSIRGVLSGKRNWFTEEAEKKSDRSKTASRPAQPKKKTARGQQ